MRGGAIVHFASGKLLHYLSCLHRLTAFVVKSFHQARKHVYISQGVLDRAISFITRYQNYDGSFRKIGSVHDTMLKVGRHLFLFLFCRSLQQVICKELIYFVLFEALTEI